MDKKKILIVEDDPSSMKMLEKLIDEIDVSTACYKASSLKQAYEILHENLIDVFLIDIILDNNIQGDVSGMILAEEIRKIERYKFTPILFITSLQDPKMYAYSSVHSFKYIEKPFPIKETKESIEYALGYKTELERDKPLYFRKDGILISVNEKDIVYIETKLHMITIYTTKEETTIPYKTCKDMMEILDDRYFVQCNRNIIVNRKYICNIDTVNLYICLNDYFVYGNVNIGRRYLYKVLDGVKVC